MYVYIELLKNLDRTNKCTIPIAKIFEEINHLLLINPHIQKTLNELPSQMTESLDMEEDLGFLDSEDY